MHNNPPTTMDDDYLDSLARDTALEPLSRGLSGMAAIVPAEKRFIALSTVKVVTKLDSALFRCFTIYSLY